jgi:hypothetical protein
MPSQEDIQGQEALLVAHRQTLRAYLHQRATLSTAYTPPGVVQGIAEARANVQRIKSTLRSWGVVVDDHPDDEESAVPYQSTTVSAPVRRFIYPIAVGVGLLVLVIIVLRPILSGRSFFPDSPISTAAPVALDTTGASPIPSSQTIVCITSTKSPGTPAKVLRETLAYFSTNQRSIKELLLFDGQIIPFNKIKSFKAIGVDDSTGGLRIEITLINGTKVDGVVQYSQYEGTNLQGSTEFGKFELRFLDVNSVDFLGQC